MKTILHVRASPRGPGSVSTRVAESFLDAHLKVCPDAKIDLLDVFATDVPEFTAAAAAAKYAVLAGAEPTDAAAGAWKKVVEVVDQLKAAELIVISSPMWNLSIPYRLKQWIDVIVQPGLTFSFSPEHGYRPLLTGKTAVLILARGGEYANAAEMDMQKPYLHTILGFVGITDTHTIIIEPTLLGGAKVAQEKLQQATARAEVLARQV